MISGMLKSVAGNGYELEYSPEWEVQIYYSGVSSDADLWEELPEINIPILIIRGSETNTFFPQTARRVKKRLPSVKVVTLEKSTHLVPLEKPEEVAEKILDFLEAVS
jgi:pimeloyl-ACP methyl ester carboxylesterase